MGWSYSNWHTQATLDLKISVLDQHLQEISDQITATVAAGGSSRDAATLQTQYNTLLAERNRLARLPGNTAVGGGGKRVRAVRISFPTS